MRTMNEFEANMIHQYLSNIPVSMTVNIILKVILAEHVVDIL